MATPKIIADFESQLATAIAVAGTSFTLASATDDDGTALPAGLYYFTVDNGSSSKEYLAGTLSGTSVTGVLSVSRQGVETSGAARAHRVGASVIITDFATYKVYMDEIALVSAPDASTTAKGVLEAGTTAEIDADTASGGTGAALAVTPDKLVLSKYGTRLPTADQKAALAGTSGSPSVSNKYVTDADTATTPTSGKVVRLNGLNGVSRVLAVSASTTEIADNSSTETDIISLSIPAALLQTTNAIRFKIYVSDFTAVSTSPGAATFRLKYGSTTLASVATTVPGGTSTLKGIIEGQLVSASTSSQLGAFSVNMAENQLDPLVDYGSATTTSFLHAFASGTAAENSAGALNFKFTIQWAGTSATNNFVPAGYIVELIS